MAELFNTISKESSEPPLTAVNLISDTSDKACERLMASADVRIKRKQTLKLKIKLKERWTV